MESISGVSGQLPPEDYCPRLELGFGSRSVSVLVLGATRQLPPRKIAPAARVRVWLGVSFGIGGQFFLGAIGLEPISGTLRRKEDQLRENEISDSTSFEEFELSEYHY